MAFPTHLLPSIFGLLGNIISFFVFLAPLPTFYRIYKKKSTEGFQSVPYSVSLFSCMILLYYGFLKTENGMMIITINAIGCVIEMAYIAIFLIYATKESMISTVKLVIIFNILTFGLIVITTNFATQRGTQRVTVVGWICAVFSVCVFAAPLSIMRLVIKTKSVEYMPFSLSFFLTLCAVMWFFYGLLIKDYFVATPNVLGFAFGIAQMILYIIYNDKKKEMIPAVHTQCGRIPTMVDIDTIMETQEKAGTELGVIVEIQAKRAEGDEVNGDKKEDVAKVSLEFEGKKTVMSSTV